MFRLCLLFLAAVILGVWPWLEIARAGDTFSSGRQLPGGSVNQQGQVELVQSKQLTEEVIPGQETTNSAAWPKPMEGQPKEISPEDVVAMSLIDEGKRHMAEGDYEEAVERFEGAVSMSPSQPRGYYFLARISFLQKQYRQALAFLSKAELLFGSNPEWQGEVCVLRGAVYEEGGDQAKARLAYESALRFNPQNLSALSGLTRLYESREETHEPPSR